MDPLSITASALTLVGACRQLAASFRFVRDLSNAPAEITEVSEELNDLQHVLTTVGMVTAQRTDHVFEVLLSPLFVKVDQMLEELCNICGACSQRLKHDADYTESLKIQLLARFKWTREKGRVAGLRERLKVLRLDFANQLAAISLLDLAQLKSDLRSVSLRPVCAATVSSPVIDFVVDQPPVYEETSGEMQTPTAVPLTMSAENSLQQNHVSTQARAEAQKPIAKDPNALQVIKACSCACHTMTRIKSPLMLQRAFGSLLIKSNGLYGSPACNEFSCHCHINARINVSYRFPEWLLGRLVSCIILSNSLDGPQLSLVMPRVVSYSSDIFFYAMSGNIQGIMNLFEKGLAAPSDVNNTWGYSALHYAVDKGHIDLCKFLLNAGARPDVQDLDENSVTDLAWNQICLRKISPAKAAAFAAMFAKDAWFEARRFTHLHNIVLNQAPTPQDLAQELSNSTKIIDVADSEGRTPLSWAAEVGNANAVETLLNFGASTTTKSVTGLTPLHYAARSRTSACMAVLLKYGASVHAKNKWDQSPLNIAAYFQNDPSFFRLLLDRGAAINEKDSYGSAALNCTFMNNDRAARYLLSRGADINTLDNRSSTPLCDAIESNSHECISLLLDSGANLAITDDNGDTALHLLAHRSDLATLQIFLAADIGAEDLNPDIVNKDGFTAKDLMTQRVDGTRELETGFQQLLAKLDPWSNTGGVKFHDALEEPWVDCHERKEKNKGSLVDVSVEEILVE